MNTTTQEKFDRQLEVFDKNVGVIRSRFVDLLRAAMLGVSTCAPREMR